jgi:hypothetical protein
MRLPTLIAALSLALGLSACISASQLAILSAGPVACAPEEITVGHEVSSMGFYSWQAACRGRVYQCSAWGSTTCRELVPTSGPQGPVGPSQWQVPGSAQPPGMAPMPPGPSMPPGPPAPLPQ